MRLTCSQRDDADGRLSADQFVPDGLQYSQHPAHRPVAPADQHPELGDLLERVEAEQSRERENILPQASEQEETKSQITENSSRSHVTRRMRDWSDFFTESPRFNDFT